MLLFTLEMNIHTVWYQMHQNTQIQIVLIFILWYFYLISKQKEQILYTNLPPALKFLSLINNI